MISIQGSLEDPHILRIEAISLSPLSLVLEYCPYGDLESLLANPDVSFSRAVCFTMALDIAKGIQYLQSQHPPIVHQYLQSSSSPYPLIRLSNLALVMIQCLDPYQACAKISDFRLSRLVYEDLLIDGKAIGNPICTGKPHSRS